MDLSVFLVRTRYDRQSIRDYHRHSCGKAYQEVRSGISRPISKHIKLTKKKNWTLLDHHDARGYIGSKKMQIYEKKNEFLRYWERNSYYESYKEKSVKKSQIINEWKGYPASRNDSDSH